MDNFLPFSSSNANSVEELSMDLNNNPSRFSTLPTSDHHHQAQPHPLLPPYSYVASPVDQTAAMKPQIPVIQTGSEYGSLVYNPGFRQARGGFLDPHTAKMARINRKKAMIRSRNNSSPNSSTNEMVDSRRQVVLSMKNSAEIAARKDLYRFSSFDNKKLRVLLVKHLKNSDVGSLGRIVLPKREAERNLPELSTKEGMIVEMRDADSMQNWSFKYKFWSNNKSRMYVLENTGEFVTRKRVEIGDFLTIYEDESKNLYFSIRKYADKPNEGREDEWMEANDMNFYEDIEFDFIPKDEEEDSIAMLIGNLNDHYPNPNNLMDLPIDLHHHQQATSSLPHVDYMTNPQHGGSSNDHMSFNDFVW
ncbi:B3 domain-containing transcription factor LEC2 [Raphanus sativus]|uniref:B3 domain-containing transcription factor LEC2 n=1 Tax=Raphanus sativus TaxID=3726 RepID=A0A6J0NX17_RAPSA|nr:B3 domain-containing transcription factor LEC2 [Raphanus sativus]KAJ4916754.1 B3 domain-containing transcription factor LEC2 [Raphanus sativus]